MDNESSSFDLDNTLLVLFCVDPPNFFESRQKFSKR